MLSPSHELGSPTAAARRSRKIVLKTLPTLSRVISPTKPTGLTQELSLEYKEENEEEKDSTSNFDLFAFCLL